MENNRYYENTVVVLREQYADYGLPAGIEESFFDDVIDEDILYRHIRASVKAAYAGQEYVMDTASLKDNLYQKLLTYAETKNVDITKDIQDSLSHLSDLCISAYKKQADQVLLRMLGQAAHRFRTPLLIGVGVLSFLGVICLIMIWKLSSLSHRAIRFWNAGFLGASVMLIALPAWLYFSKGVERLGITSPALRPLMISYANALFMAFLVCGIVIAIAVFTLGIIGVHLLKRKGRS